ncbi:MAG: hypothetical protein LQ343_003738 [Gyalolechia ehrenbergii]|nr:MAG: hypothetical protein LQ343_003738 [Gyalolechia ehrenbergii]
MFLIKEGSRASENPRPTNFDQEMSVDRIEDDSSDAFGGFESDEEEEKDSTELELEAAVFGDEAGFHERLKRHGVTRDNRDFTTTVAKDVQDEAEDDIRDIDDADLFILDSGPSKKPPLPQLRQGRESSSDASDAAWHDSDDERITVSLRTNPRLRKLRNYGDEDLINGKEYTKRLRRQFEHLYPIPDWIIQAQSKTNRHANSRRSLIASPGSNQGSSSEDEMCVDSNELSVPPLAKLLQQPDACIRPDQGAQRGKKKLRPEVIDMQRTKDVGVAQPSAITSLDFHPRHPLLLSSGPSSTISLHHLSPRLPNPNPLLTSLHIRSTPLTTSSFRPPDGTKILFSGRQRYFHAWDLSSGHVDKISRIYGHQSEQKSMERFKMSPCGRWMGLVGSQRKGGGLINILDAQTNQWTAEVRVESKGGVADFEWWGDGEGLTVLGKAGEAVEWAGRQKKIVGRWVDEGAVGTTVVAMGGPRRGAKDIGGDSWVAVGSSSGIPSGVLARWKVDGNGKPVEARCIEACPPALLYGVQKLANLFDAIGTDYSSRLLAFLRDTCCSE